MKTNKTKFSFMVMMMAACSFGLYLFLQPEETVDFQECDCEKPIGKINSETVSLEGALLSENLPDEEIHLVQNSTKLMRKSLDEFANAFYRELFKTNPVIKTLFLTNIKSQARKFAQMFELLVISLNDVEKVIPSLKALGRRHANYGINESHYGIVGGALINTLDKSLGTNFTEEVKNAWLKTYGIVTMIMIDSSKGLI